MGLKAAIRSAALALLVLAAGTAGADPKEAHKLGVEAIAAGRWADAERFFRAAIAERPEEKVNRLLKTAYLPHYYLGVALAEQGRCRAAVDFLAASDRQGQIHKSRYAEDLSRRRQQCRDHLRQLDAARTEVEQLMSRVGDASSSLAGLSRTPELAPRWQEEGFGARQQQADQKLADARRSFAADAASNGDLERLDGAKARLTQALTEIEAARADARRRLGELNAAAAAALEQLAAAEQSAGRALRSVSDLAPYPRRLGSRVAAVERTLKEIRDSKSGASAQRLQALNDELTASVASLRRAARRPPQRLTQAAEAFLAGSFEQALELLEEESLAGDRRSKSHVCLLRAASGHALWVLGGESDEQLRELATAAIAACAGSEPGSDPGLEPSPKFFSPRFVEFRGATLEALARAAEAGEPEGEDAPPAEDPAAAVPATGSAAPGDSEDRR